MIHAEKAAYKEFIFTEKAILGRALEGKAAIEAGRIVVDVFSLGFAEISRATMGTADHWAFIARGNASGKIHPQTGGVLPDGTWIYYMVEIGADTTTANLFDSNPDDPRNDDLVATGVIFFDFANLEDSLRVLGPDQNIWFVYTYKPLVTEDATIDRLEECAENYVAKYPRYKLHGNNCQFFSKALYEGKLGCDCNV